MEPSHDVKIGIEKLNVITDKIGDNTYLHLYHGTKKSNHTKIIKSGKFKSGTFFTPDEKIALRYARMTGGTPIHMLASINADGLTFNGYYFIAKQDLIFKNGKYEPKNPIMESRVLDNKKVYQNLDEETFIHFTTLPRAKEIKESRHLLINPPYEKFGSDTVDAISATLGKYVPKTQHTHIGDINKLVAILFKTDKVPDYGYPEEVKWHEDVPLKDIRIVRVKDAIKMLNNNNSPDEEDYEIAYKKEPVMESFIKSLSRHGNESLIEAIIKGYNIIFESEQLSLFKEGDIKLSPKEISIKKAKEILDEEGDSSIEQVIDNLTEEDGINELLIESLFKLKNIDYEIIDMVDDSKSLVFNIDNKVKMISGFKYPVTIYDAEELIMEGVSSGHIDDIVPKGREYLLKLDEEFNKDFWESPGDVYHGTNEENVKDILNDGINAGSETRGISNRSIDAAVFTSSDLETARYFYDKVFKINTSDMKTDGYTPFVYQEPDIYEKNLAEALAHLYDIENFHYDIEQGMDEGTIIFDGNIPPKYVELMD